MKKEIPSVFVSNPDCLLYPFEKAIYENPKVAYHGTTSSYAKSVEENGLDSNHSPYNVDDLKEMIETFHSIGLRPMGSESIEILLYEIKEGLYKNSVYVSVDYWYARHYAIKPGGEVVKGIMQATEIFSDIVEDDQQYDQHLRLLKSNEPNDTWFFSPEKRKGFLPIFQQRAELLEKAKYLSVMAAKAKEHLIGGFPVVYALEVEDLWFETPPKRRSRNGIVDDFNAKCLEQIPCERILGKVEFTNGAMDWLPLMNAPMPLGWALEEFRQHEERRGQSLERIESLISLDGLV